MTGITRRTLLSGAAAGAAGGALGLSVRGAGAAGEITFVTPFGYLIGFAPVLYAASGGFFEAEGLSVTIQGGKGSAMAVQQVLSGQAAFSRTGGVDLMKAKAGQGAEIVSIATVTQASPLFMISPDSAPIDTAADMAGKTIGVISKGGLAENLLDMILKADGVDAAAVPREAVGNAPGAFGLVQAGRIDGYIASMGTVVKLKAAGEPVHSWNTDRYAPIPGQVYLAQESTVAQDPDLIRAFLRAVNGSMQALFAAEDLGPVIASIAAFEVIGIDDRETIAMELKAEMELYAAEGPENLLRNVPERWAKAAALMASVGLIPETDPATFYTNAFIDAVKGA